MNEILLRLLWGQLQSIGLFTEKNPRITDLKPQNGLQALYDRWLEETIAVLTRNHYLIFDQDKCTVQDPTSIDMDDAWKEWDAKKSSWLKDSNMKGQVTLVEASLRALPDILTGKTPATDVLFPNSSTKMVEGVYKGNPIADYFNEALADMLIIYIEERLSQDPSAQIRIIEIGAGSGGTSAIVFKKLKPYRDHIKEYCYTDISKAFLMHAEKEYGPQNSYLTYRIFDVEAPLAGQGIEAGGYDLTIAANVLHATKNIRYTLRNAKTTLKRNGLLLLNEISGNALFTHLTFGLLKGWWLYEDAELRIPGCPGLSPQTWQAVLEDEGFRSVFFPVEAAHELGQQIIVSESDGIVRQKKQVKMNIETKAGRSLTSQDLSQRIAAQEQQPAIKNVVPRGDSVTDQMIEDHVRTVIKESVAEALKMEEEQIQDDRSFSEYGVDSIIVVNLVNLINQQFCITLQTTVLFDYNNVDQLTKHIIREHQLTLISSLQETMSVIETSIDSRREAIPAPVWKKENLDHSTNRRLPGSRFLVQDLKPQVSIPAANQLKNRALESANSDLGTQLPKEPIAIIGMSGRFAKSKNVNDLWEHLAKGNDLIEEASRWNLSEHYPEGTSYCKHGSFLDDIDRFDPLFFNISGLEATFMDPQQRFFLEESWKALEDAGYAGAGVQGHLCGVYVGCSGGDYSQLFSSNPPPQAFWGNAGSVIPARIAYYLDLQGPAIAVDTACSSSLVAIHLACQGLWTGETEMALAGGVFIQCTPDFYLAANRASMLSPTGRCHTFDEWADGFVPGEGVGVVVLKRLKDAIADGDHIYGVIRGSGINQDGATNGITAPSAKSQERLERYVYDTFHIHPEGIQMVEAHGTGTKLGDPIEYQALTRSFRAYTDKQEYCAIGSIKSNLGHATAAAGIAGFIKVLLSLQHKQIPPSLHFQSGNSHIQFKDSPFYVNTSLKDWDVEAESTRCAVTSSFGFSGTNAHVALEEAHPIERRYSEKPGYLIVLSARTFEQLKQQVEQLLGYCEREPQADFGNMSHTLLLGRKHFNHRLACVGRSQQEMITHLNKWLEKGKVSQVYVAELQESDHREQPSLKRYGNECIQNCRNVTNASEYLEHLATISDLYVQGYELDFEQLFINEQYSKISLPTYPFARESYWVSESETTTIVTPATAAIGHPLLPVSEGEKSLTATAAILGTLMLHPVWKEQAVDQEATTPDYIHHVAMFCEPDAVVRQILEGKIKGVRCLTLDSKQGSIEERFQDYAIQVLEEIQGILKEKATGKVLVQIITSLQDEHQLFAGLSGLLKTTQLENPKLFGQLIEIEPVEGWAGITKKLEENSRRPLDQYIRYQNGKRCVAGWSELEVSPEAAKIPWKDQGVYLITGGAGGLGQLFARDIVHIVKNPTLILAGRSALSAAKQAELKEWEALGARIEYQQVDVTQKAAVDSLLQYIQDHYGSLQGIIHSAGVIKDNFIIKKTSDELQAVLAPKVAGLVNLDQASRELPLDFFILFSSVAGSLGNVGQADYAAANAFMDAYAKYRNALVVLKGRHGQTLSINWPLWQEGGMRIDAETERIMRQSLGMTAMQTAGGIQALYQALASGKEQVMVIEGDLSRIRALLLENLPPVPAYPMASYAPVDPWLLREKTLHQLKILFGEITKLSVDRINHKEPLESYGIDSIMITQLNQKLDGIFGELSKTLFYEYQTLSALTDYLTADYPQQCLKWTGLQEQAQPMPRKSIVSPSTTHCIDELPVPSSLKTGRKLTHGLEQTSYPSVNEPIAIIGMSGRYPRAKTLQDYWENLKTGRDCITEIPQERWSLDGFYHSDSQEAVSQGKSYSKWGGFVEGFADFDPLFFNISPREANDMDPQERLFVEACWNVLEDGGYTKERLETQYNRRVGVFAGITKTGFELYSPDLWKQGEKFHLRTSFGSVANRISYLLNLQGPSMPIDTMCSSSLTAIHEACEHIYRGECEIAIAGGVNLYLHPSSYIGLCGQRMLSVDGKCKSFGLGGNGFVPGEGVGVVLLKRLSQALSDEDHIYAVIRGTSINHGGKTNGYTVPNPIAQGDLIRMALDKAGVDARTVSYIEAHGTGTELGDPIEITGLSQAFQKDTQDTGFCAIGSVKSNIGHLEAAAGIAGVAKIILQMNHKELVPSLHAEELNPNINFGKTPFLVQRELTEWKRPMVKKGGESKEYPRIAGISSFGAGGSNAHVVLEEYIPKNQERSVAAITPQNPVMILLSAKNEDGLQACAQQLLSAIQKQQFTDSELADVAYTLQVGREAMEERLAVLAGSVKELAEKLQGFVEGQNGMKELYRGQVKRHKETVAALGVDEEMLETMEKWMQRRKYGKVLDLWVKGFVVDWNKLYGDTQPRRISLPTYPFARERYWLPEIQEQPAGRRDADLGRHAVIHPLLQQNISDFSEQRFTSTFTGQEFFLADHVVKGQRVLPGVAYLEMARAAVEQAAGVLTDDQTVMQLKNVVWIRPLAVGKQPVKVHIGVFPEEGGEIAFEIYSESQEAGAEPVIHSQGIAVLSQIEKNPSIDLSALQAQCSQNTLVPSQCYEAFKLMGLQYGASHQGIEMMYVGAGQVLAKLSLPSAVFDTREQFVLHPSLLDSALQTSIGLMMETDDKAALKPLLPFALHELEILGRCTPVMWALIRFSDGSKVGDKVEKLDIDLCDDQGHVCIRMKGLSSRVLEGEIGSAEAAAAFGMLLLHPCWKEQAIAQEAIVPKPVQHVVMLCEPNKTTQKMIKTQIDGVRCLIMQSKQEGIEERFQVYVTQVFEEIQNILKARPAGKVLVQIVVPNRLEQQVFAGLSGLLKTAQLENPKLIGQLIEIDPDEDPQKVTEKLKENSQSCLDNHVRYQEDKRYVASLSQVKALPETVKIPWKDQGVYLIVGGVGGLGLIFVQEIAQKVKDTTLILTGRCSLNENKQGKLRDLESLGARIIYRQVNLSEKKAVDDLIQSIQADFGGINGIIHSAGVIKDNFIIKKTKEELQAVLAPKVAGLVYLDQASKELPLDFFILFSSGAGVVGNPGQADYAAANAFMDAYAVYRCELVASNQRHGQTLSINWPLWQEGGMHIDVQTETMMRQNTGMVAMQTASGIRALYQSVAAGKNQVMVMEGDRKKLRAGLLTQQMGAEVLKAPYTVEKNKTAAVIDQDSLPAKAANYFKKLLSSVLKLPAHRIEADAPLEQYGIDSVMVMQLTNQLEKTFGSLPKTLFFEYQNIQELASYFLENYRVQLTELWGIQDETAAPPETSPDFADGRDIEKSALRSQRRPRFASLRRETREDKEALDIAIIGVAGRYPQAGNIQEFWKNLREGKDCITEIPKDRWDYSLYFDEDKNKPGKTYSKWGGFLSGVDQFDPLFFNISPREAQIMDPQERLFLECVYETLEDAGYTKEALGLQQSFGLGGNVGVYVGVMYEEYQLYGAQEQIQGRPFAVPGSPASIANRISYFFNFHGPSMAVDTMCSSSLTSIHLACQSLQRGGCEVAIAGGVNVSIHPNKYLLLSQGKFASSKGRCESFGQGGEGYVPGEGVGALLLKPLAKAVADGDHIYGVIKGTAINHGGKTNGYTVPNPNAQASVIERAFKEAGIDPRTISYIEAHGTGTSLGDPIEIAGLTKTFQAYTKDKQFCAIGSAKSNIGHCESAAGIAGVTKVLLQLKYRQLVPSLHSRTLNPNIDFNSTPFVVQQELGEWKRPMVEKAGESKEYPRIAGISSFGAGGANAHVVIEEYIPQNPVRATNTLNAGNSAIIVLSAKNEERLREQVQQLLTVIQEQQFTDRVLGDMAYTLQVGREAMEERLAVFAGSIKELQERLRNYLDSLDGTEGLYRGQVKRNKETMDIFSADEDMSKIMDAWISKGKYEKLLDLWVKGLVVDWNRLYGDSKPHRISLPTYPFAKERYWLFEEKNTAGSVGIPATLPAGLEDRPVQRAMCYLQKQWELCMAVSTPILNRTIAIVTTQETMELAIQLAEYFPESQIIDLHDLASHLQQPASYWEHYNGCVDLIGCGKEKNELPNWMVWLQQVTEYGQREGLMMLCVTKGLESYQNTAVNLSGASRTGLYRMLQSEYKYLRSRHMDAEPSISDQALAQQIAAEFSMESEDAEVCYRGGERYRAYLKEFEIVDGSDPTFVFPDGHVLWITGGTRGIGALCAQHFVAKHGVRHLVLTGRETIPPREEWHSYKQQNTSIAKKIHAIQALEAQGVTVQVLSVSLTDEFAVQKSLQEIKSTMGPIGGIIHCAGMDDMKNPAFIRKSVKEIQQVLDPKVTGLDILYRSLTKEPLQFFVLFSSVSAIVPALASGQSDYAMANAYMDYVAEAKIHNYPIVSIQWPSWKETGMGEAKSRAYQQTGFLTHTNEEGLRLLDHILAGKIGPVVLPAVVNPELWKPYQLMQRRKQEIVAANTRPRHPIAAKTVKASDSMLTATQTWLTNLFSQELKLEPSKLEVDIPFQDYGVDSILLAQLLRSMNQLLENDLDPSILFEYSTIESLAAWFVSNHASSLAKILDTMGSKHELLAQDSSPAAQSTSTDFSESQGLQKKSRRTAKPLDIAVIGLSCRFPGANNVEEYWQLLAEGRSAIRSVPQERWGYSSNFSAGLIDNITQFDAKFFLIPENDVKAMDPQALVVLEESLKLWYHAGYSQQEIKGKQVGVYLGGRSQHHPDEFSLRQAINPIVTLGQNYLAANISQFFDLRGPSIVVDTACSSALIGMNMAIQALNNGEIESAIVGGVSLLNTDEPHRLFQQRGILSSEPSFHIFDQRSSGVVLGEGVGMVLLKTVDQAIEDGDHIYAVIKALAINNDGRTAGPATPNLHAQKEVLQTALARSGKKAEEIIYMEANGSGSEVTDLLELKAIQSVYRPSSIFPLALGSVKPNIGHPLCAEGIASFIKVVLMLQHRQFVPFLSGEKSMTHYNIESSPFHFYRKLVEWTNTPQIAGINCFADGGTNAHAIVQAWEDSASRSVKRHPNPPPAINQQQFGKTDFKKSTHENTKQILQTNSATSKVIWEKFN
jgi:polyketide synthase PksN